MSTYVEFAIWFGWAIVAMGIVYIPVLFWEIVREQAGGDEERALVVERRSGVRDRRVNNDRVRPWPRRA